MQRLMLYLSGSVFGLVACIHVVRLLLHLEIVIQGWVVPLWTSAVAAIAAVVLAWLCLRAAASRR